jgi:hypothetical protein
MRFATMLTVALVVVSLGVVPATAATISLGASANAFGMNGVPDTNFPSTNPYGDVLMANWVDGGTNCAKSWVKFDLSAISGTATSATIQMTRAGGAVNAPDPILVGALLDGDPGEAWGETTLTWNNAPGNVLDQYLLNWTPTGNVKYVGNFSYSAAGGVGDVLTVSSADLLAAVNGDTNRSLTLVFAKRGYDQADGAAFASRTNAFYAGPTLVLEGVTQVPEPSTAMLLCAGLAGLLAYAWRKQK